MWKPRKEQVKKEDKGKKGKFYQGRLFLKLISEADKALTLMIIGNPEHQCLSLAMEFHYT